MLVWTSSENKTLKIRTGSSKYKDTETDELLECV